MPALAAISKSHEPSAQTSKSAPASRYHPDPAPAPVDVMPMFLLSRQAPEQGGYQLTDESDWVSFDDELEPVKVDLSSQQSEAASDAEPDALPTEGEEALKAVSPPNPRQAIAPAIAAVHNRSAAARRHRPSGVLVKSAQSAAIEPQTEQVRGAATLTVTRLDDAKTQEVRRAIFKQKLKDAIDKATPQPQSESEAKRVMETGATEASNALHGELAAERDVAAGPLKATTAKEVQPGEITTHKKTALDAEEIGPPPAPVPARLVVPEPLPSDRLDYSSDREPSDALMAEHDLDREQLERGAEPEFDAALEARGTAEQHESTVEARYRTSESGVRDQAQGMAHQALDGGLTGIHGARELRIASVIEEQFATRSQDELERRRVTGEVQRIKDTTREAVESILTDMESRATDIFEAGLKRAEKAYRDTFEEEKGGIGTWLTTWGSDWERLIERSLRKARVEYLWQVDVAIDDVADLVESSVALAKQRVADGRQQVDDYVEGLDDSVREYGEEALREVEADFDAMVTGIDSRRDGLVDRLADQYKASYERMSAMEEELREANKSLWQRVYDATVGLIKKILAFKDMLLGVLGKAAGVIRDIISDPIGFLKNLVSGIMQGLRNFMAKIGAHLQKGLMDWLLGAFAGTGLRLPEKFDLPGVASLVLQILGITYDRFRARAVKLVGEPVVAALEKAAEIFRIMRTEGVAGLWRFIMEKLLALKSMVLDPIYEFIKERVIIAGVTWIIGLLNPASAFFKACKAIYDLVTFFINKGRQIAALVSAIVDSIASIAKGALGTAIGLVEGALVKAIPVAIGFLASLLNLGDPAAPVRAAIESVRALVDQAIDWVINQAMKLGRAVLGALGFGGREEEGEEDAIAGDSRLTLAEFEEGGQDHSIYVDLSGAQPSIMVASEKAQPILTMLDHFETRLDQIPVDGKRRRAGQLISLARNAFHAIPTSRYTYTSVIKRSATGEQSARTDTEGVSFKRAVELSQPLGNKLRELFQIFCISRRMPSATDPKAGSMQMFVEITIEDVPGSTSLPPDQVVTSDPDRPASAQGRRGGQVFGAAGTAQGRTFVQARTWNTGDPMGRGDNASHAEHHFVNWFSSQPEPWRSRVRALEIHNRRLSPCSSCSDELTGLLRDNPQIQTALLFWSTPYVLEPITTRKHHLSAMQGVGWVVHPGAGALELTGEQQCPRNV